MIILINYYFTFNDDFNLTIFLFLMIILINYYFTFNDDFNLTIFLF